LQSIESDLLAGTENPDDLTAAPPLPILAVDDVPENLRTLEAVLGPLGYPLRTASSGGEALRLLLDHEFSLILLDVRMPGLDGLETAQLIKGRERTRDIPIVFLTAARDEVRDIIRGYGIGAVDYVLKPFDAELLRSKVAVFAELEASRRALKRSEALLRGAFEAAPIGKTVLDGTRRVVRSNPAFAHMVGREPAELHGVPIASLCRSEDVPLLSDTLDRVASSVDRPAAGGTGSVDLRLVTSTGIELWAGIVASSIEPTELAEPLLLVQWVDLSVRRRAEAARAELLVEQAARAQAEAMADRLEKLQALTNATETLSIDDLLAEFALRLVELFDAEMAELEVRREPGEPAIVRATGARARPVEADDPRLPADRLREEPLLIEGSEVGVLRLLLGPGREFSAAERSLLHDAAERAALGIMRALLHEEEHRIAVILQRGLLPKSVPTVPGVELAVHYEAAGLGAEVGGDWYDAFVLPGERLGIVLGDVAGRSIPAASAMGQLRTVTRAFALMDGGRSEPGDVLTRLNDYQLALAEDEMFTVVYVIVDPGAARIAWSSAGHPPPLVRTGDGEAAYLDGGEGLIGIEQATYRTLTRPVGAGDVLVLYTDGVVERRGEPLDAGLERLAGAVSAGPADPDALCDHILRELLPPGSQLDDDVTALLARISPRPRR
jgi:PAS domain S-box-containing protein